MGYKLKSDVSAQWLAAELGLKLVGIDASISSVSQLGEIEPLCLTFSKKEYCQQNRVNATIIGDSGIIFDAASILHSENPRLDFARALLCLECKIGFVQNDNPPKIHPSVEIGKNVVIEDGVQIGKDTVIGHNVVLKRGVKIGDGCIVQSSTVIGDDGFGFEKDVNDVPIRLLHLGSVIIGNHVEIGNLVTIDRGMLSDTVIGNSVKIDNHVHVAHNCKIGQNSIVTACAAFSGSVAVGENVWVGVNASIVQKVNIGNNVTLGVGSVVTESVVDRKKIMGLNSLNLRSLIKVKKNIGWE